MVPDVVVAVAAKTDVAEARRRAAEFAAFDNRYAGALNLVLTELGTNLIKHGGGGELIVHRTGVFAASPVDVISIDHGPGMVNPARCFSDGYSTAGSPGTGLGAIVRASAFVDFYSEPQKGAVIVARVGPPDPAGDAYEIGAVCAALAGEVVSGDSWAFHAEGDCFRLALCDGLGHGILAADASSAGIEAAMSRFQSQPGESLELAHRLLRSTRGAAMSIVDVNTASGTALFAGVGNVAGSVVHETRRQMIAANGTLGHEMRSAPQFKYAFPPGARLVLHSDGVSTNWTLDKYPGLFHCHPSVIAGVLFRDHRRIRDDATIVIAGARRRPK